MPPARGRRRRFSCRHVTRDAKCPRPRAASVGAPASPLSSASLKCVQAPDPLLDRQTLERLERLAIRWQQSFRGLLGGNNLSRYAGAGHEFLDHRHYQQGDDLRSVNWRAYLRLGRLFLKMFRTEPRTPVRLMIDTSESMSCGASERGGEPKFTYACRLAAALCYIGLVRLESIVIQPFSDVMSENFRSEGGRHRFAGASQFIGGLSTGGRSDFAAAARQFLQAAPSSGFTIILSDFLSDGNEQRALQYLADHGQELMLIHLAGPEDAAPFDQGEFELVDAESGEVLRMSVDRPVIDDYVAAFEQHAHDVEYAALRNGGRYTRLTTDVDLDDALYGALMFTGSLSLQ